LTDKNEQIGTIRVKGMLHRWLNLNDVDNNTDISKSELKIK